ncbi:rhomboid family intramembrane serine protease [Bacillus sp. 37MA]|uniref:rhomboid family intramembrane serine protease n=1 Tax=Bacillus sp. 37MA TaxID=1132442 RepID=UPI000364679F|nr:rhomboid family intramembrane serine protease [Bacillus sp. 37MA]
MYESSDEMNIQTDVIFWRLAFFFVVEQEYTIARLSQDKREIWLENRSNKEAMLIRLKNQDLGWAAELGRDVKRIVWNGEQIRKKMGMRKLSLLNIVVSQHPPVDEYESYLKPVLSSKGGKTKADTLLFTGNGLSQSLRQLELVLSPVPERRDFDGAEDEAVAYERSVLSHEVKRKEEEERFFHYGKPFFTYIFTAINIILFIMMTFAGGSTNTAVLLEFGAKFNPLILEGEWWRFITPMFLHIGLLHLVMNSLALYYLGIAVEQIYGRLRFIWIYLFSGFTGSLLSFLLTPNLAAGASGAIFGLFGALLYFGVTKPKLFFRTMGMNVLFVIGINLVFGFTVPGIDNAGHIGGLIGGFLATGIVHFPKKRRVLQQLAFTIATVAAVAMGLMLGFQSGHAALDADSVNLRVQEEINAGNDAEAEQMLKAFLEDGGEPSAETYFYLAFIEMGDGRLIEAEQHLRKATRERANFHEAHFNLSLIYMENGQLEKAKQSVEEALAYAPDEAKYQELAKNLSNGPGE